MVTSPPWPNPRRAPWPTRRRPLKTPGRPNPAGGGLGAILDKGICSAIDRVARPRTLEPRSDLRGIFWASASLDERLSSPAGIYDAHCAIGILPPVTGLERISKNRTDDGPLRMVRFDSCGSRRLLIESAPARSEEVIAAAARKVQSDPSVRRAASAVSREGGSHLCSREKTL
jgi:hypothetical protein